MTIASSEGCFRNITISDFKLMMTRSKVYLGEMASILKLVKQVINPGDGILILDCDLVQLSIVNEHSERIIFLPYEKNDSPHGEILGLMKPLSRRYFNFPFNSSSSATAIK